MLRLKSADSLSTAKAVHKIKRFFMATPKLKLVIDNQSPPSARKGYRSVNIHLADRRYIAPGARIVTQSAANNLPSIDYRRQYQIRHSVTDLQRGCLRVTVGQCS